MKDERKTKKQLIEELNEVRRQIEKLWATSNEPAIRTLMNASKSTAILIEPNGTILTVNALMADRIGRSIDELEGKNIFDLIPPEAVKPRKKLIRKVIRSGKAEYFESDEYADKVLSVSTYPIMNTKGMVTQLAVFEHDITERIQAEEKLKESEERYRNLFEASPQGILIANLKGTITSCNSAFLALSGYSEEEIVGKHFSETPTFLAEDLPRSLKMFASVLRGEVNEAVEFKGRHKDGNICSAKCHIGLLKEKGKISGFQVIVEDITERKQAEEALKLTQFSVERTSDVACWIGPDAHIIYANDAACQSLGYTKDELLTMTVHDIDPEFPAEVWPEHWRELKEKGSMIFQSTHRAKDGREFPVEININYLEYQGEEYNFCFARDITERIEVEEALINREKRLQSFFENAAIGIAIANPKGRFLQVNSNYLEMFGYSSEEELFRKTVGEITHPDDREITRKAQRALSNGEINFFRDEKRYLRKDGSFFWGDVSVSPIKDVNGEIYAFTAIIFDITEPKKAEIALRDSEEKYRLVVENSLEGIAVVKDGLFCFTNPGVEKLLIFTKEELINKPFIEIVHPDDREIIVERYQKRLKGEDIPPSYQVRLIDKEGSIKWVEAYVVMIEWEGDTATLAFVNDITERRKAEEALRESHNYLNNILNGMFAGMLVLDLDYGIIDVNSSFLEENNISREEVIGHKCYEITHNRSQPCNSSQCVCPMRSIVETTSPTQVEHRHLSSEGEERFVEINFFPLFEADGEIGRVVEIIHDITERVRAEEQVRIEAGRAKALARIATSLNTHLDVEAVGKAICEEAAGALGIPLITVCLYDGERDKLVPAGQFGIPSINMGDVDSIPCEYYCELIQKSDPVVVFPNIQNTPEFPKLALFSNLDVRTMVSAVIQRDERFIGRMNILTIGEERTFTKDDLTLIRGLANQAAIALENARLYQSERDSHHKSEALRRAALVLTSTMAMDQVLEDILAELQKVVPYDNASVQLMEDDQLKIVTGRGFPNLADLIGTSFPARGRFRYSRVLETRKPFNQTIEVPGFDRHKSPDQVQRSWLGVPLLIGDRIIGIITLNKLIPGFYTENHGQIAMAFAAAAANAIENAQLFRDLQDKMKTLKETRDLLVQNEKLASIGELVSGIAHELNNPISATLLLAQDSLQEESTQEIKNNLDKIVSESRRTAKIVRDLLTFSKQRSPELDQIQLNDVLVYTLDLLAYEIGKSNIKVTTELSKDMPPILADPLQIQQVVINIVSNACQAMTVDPENAFLWISTETGPSIFLPESGTSQVVRVMFQDSGPGIPGYVLPRVFDPFFTTKPLGQGTGLGLSICHGIVNEHGGNIWVESELGQGATFFVELPVARVDEQRLIISEDQPNQLLTPSKYRILIIDDEESLLEILSRVLRRRGYQVVAMNNGEEGLDHAINTSPDLILCDLLMPGMSGQDIYYYLKTHASELLNHVIFTTGDTLSLETRLFLEENEVSILRKPFELEHFIDIVGKALKGSG